MTLFFESYLNVDVWADWNIGCNDKTFWFEYNGQQYQKQTPSETRALIRSLVAQKQKGEQQR